MEFLSPGYQLFVDPGWPITVARGVGVLTQCCLGLDWGRWLSDSQSLPSRDGSLCLNTQVARR